MLNVTYPSHMLMQISVHECTLCNLNEYRISLLTDKNVISILHSFYIWWILNIFLQVFSNRFWPIIYQFLRSNGIGHISVFPQCMCTYDFSISTKIVFKISNALSIFFLEFNIISYQISFICIKFWKFFGWFFFSS